MDDVRVGAILRAARRRRGLRQVDVAASVGVSQQTISRIERGQLEAVGLRVTRRVGRFLEISVAVEPRTSRTDGPGLLDARHLEIVQRTIGELAAHGWQTRLEYSFNHYGERGCVDILASRRDAEALLIVEVKSALVDAQELVRTTDVRGRVVPNLCAKELGWRPRFVGSVVVVPSETAARDAVSRYAPIFDSAFPDRTVAIRRWLANPVRQMRGLWFLEVSGRRVTRNPGSAGRIRRPG